MPPPLRPGDLIRFVSPASPPDPAMVEAAAERLRGRGFRVDLGANAFRRLHYLAGSDAERLADLDAAFADPEVRAILATRGGKGSYRIADRLDLAAAGRDPKFLVGFSDITILHLMLLKHGLGSGCIHGALGAPGDDALLDLLTGSGPVMLAASPDEATIALGTTGRARGPLIGGNLDMIATAAGWALPPLQGCILLLEAIGRWLGQVDRQLTMLQKAGHLDGIAGIALGRFTGFEPSGRLGILDLLQDHLAPLNVPILGGLPLGHGPGARPIPLGRPTLLDADRRTLMVER